MRKCPLNRHSSPVTAEVEADARPLSALLLFSALLLSALLFRATARERAERSLSRPAACSTAHKRAALRASALLSGMVGGNPHPQ